MSKIEVNTVDAQCGSTVTIGSAGKTVSVPGNIVKTNALQASDGGNIVNQCGTTVTLGATGDTIALASGASQTGFGRTGTVDWVTTPKVTGDSPVTAATGSGYFLNTTAGTITINLPAGAAGSIVSMADYAATWGTYNVTITPNGTDKIGSLNSNATLNTSGQSVTFVYVDSTQGWLNTMDSTSNVRAGTGFVTATGGTPACGTICGDYKIHKFTGPGTFCVSSIAICAAANIVGYTIVAGGGSGGTGCAGGGGGAGGFREGRNVPIDNFTASPLVADYPGANSNEITVTATGFPITVGGGGAGIAAAPHPACSSAGNVGNTSTFSTISSAGGGFGGIGGPTGAGGSGGGAGHGGTGGIGNTPPVTPAQGTNGSPSSPGVGPAPSDAGAGGGGATVTGTPGPVGHQGGAGATTSVSGASVSYAGGGGGSNRCGGSAPDIAGGLGGGGAGSHGPRPAPAAQGSGTDGSCNTGGGGGAGQSYVAPSNVIGASGSGGSGIVIIRYKFQ